MLIIVAIIRMLKIRYLSHRLLIKKGVAGAVIQAQQVLVLQNSPINVYRSGSGSVMVESVKDRIYE